jgi:hypothetical protein
MAASAREFERALLRKGFRLERSSKDKIFYFYHQGKKTEVHTKISQGRGEDLRDKLLGKIKQQMYFDTTAQVGRFIDCSIDEQAYLIHLRGKIQLPAAEPT